MKRREVLTAMLATAALGAVSLKSAPRRVPKGLKPLPFEANSLDGISERVITSHHDNNYAGAFSRLAAIENELSGLPGDAPAFLTPPTPYLARGVFRDPRR